MAEYASFWRRFAAFVIDGILLNLLIYIPLGLSGGSSGGKEGTAEVFGLLVSIIVAWLYDAGMESSSAQATPGKAALGIIVTDTEGKRISFGKATGRFFSKLISIVILGIGFIMVGFTARKQALHDIIAGCVVVLKT